MNIALKDNQGDANPVSRERGIQEPMWHPRWEPFWQAVDEVQLPPQFHSFPTNPPEAPPVRRAAMFTGVLAFRMSIIHINAGMMGRACPSAIRGCACRLTRAAPAGSPTYCTA